MFSLPFMVGTNFFMYVDEPALGISSTFPEDSNYGLINEQDEPYPELTQAATALNPQVYALHEAGQLPVLLRPHTLVDWLSELPANELALPSLPVTYRAGNMTITLPINDRTWRMAYNDTVLADFVPLMQQMREENAWIAASKTELLAVRQNDYVTVLDAEMTHDGGGGHHYSTGFRFWIPRQGQEWISSQCLWVQNDDATAWTLVNVYPYLKPELGGSNANDQPIVAVPNYFRNGAAWVDPVANIGAGCWYLNAEDYKCSYWKDEGGGFHPDLSRAVNEELAPGERIDINSPHAFFYPLQDAGMESWGNTLDQLVEEVRKQSTTHSADQNANNSINLSELLRVVQLYNSGAYACSPTGLSEDGYGLTAGPTHCGSHDSDYRNVPDWVIDTQELLRLVQIFNAGSYQPCVEEEDGFCAG
jgi:hypothetical protein